MLSLGVLRRILQMCVRAGRLDRALEVKTMCEEEGVDLSAGMVASIFELMIKTNNLTEAERTIQQLVELFPKFTIDEHKIIDFAAILIQNGDVEKAKKWLKHRTENSVNKPRSGPNVHKNIWQLLTNSATQSNTAHNQTKDLLKYLVKLGYCEYHHNALLGPVIREHFLKGEIDEAFNEFTILAKQYKRTPLQMEFLCILIELSNGKGPTNANISADQAKQYLEEMTKLCGQIYGPLNSNVTLVVAFAQAGTEKQLRKILIDPSVQFNGDLLIKQCEFLCNTGATETVQRLAKCCRGLGSSRALQNALREDELYNLLLHHFCRNNDYMGALGIFEQIAETDELKLSKEFMKNLIDLLERNNLEIPNNLKLHSQLV